MSEATDIDAILKDRGNNYGDFSGHALITQRIKYAMQEGVS